MQRGPQVLRRHETLILAVLIIIESILLLYYSVRPYYEVPLAVPGGKGYAEHLVAYVFYGLFWERAARRTRLKGYSIVAALVIGSAFGGFNEGVQALVPGRHVDVMDWVLDIAGSAIGGVISKKISTTPH
jgi:VanZ family protein